MVRPFLVSLLDQVLFQSRGMAFGTLGTSWPHKNCGRPHWFVASYAAIPEESIVLSYDACCHLEVAFVRFYKHEVLPKLPYKSIYIIDSLRPNVPLCYAMYITMQMHN